MVVGDAPPWGPILPAVLDGFAIGPAGLEVAAIDVVQLPIGVVTNQMIVGVADA